MEAPPAKKPKLVLAGDDAVANALYPLIEREVPVKQEEQELNRIKSVKQDKEEKQEKEEAKDVNDGVHEEDEEDIMDQFHEVIKEEGTEVEGKQKKKKKAHDFVDEVLPEVPNPDSDTEYIEVDVGSFPLLISVEACFYEKVNGTLRLSPKRSRGRPCYGKTVNSKEGGSKTLWFFWRKEKWHLGFEINGTKSLGSCDAEGDVFPFSPYPHMWKVQRKGDLDKFKNPQMRVMDLALLADSYAFKDLIVPDRSREEEPRPEKSSAAQAKVSKPPQKPPVKAVSKTPGTDADEDAAMVEGFQDDDDSDDDTKAASAPRSSQPGSDSNESEEDSSEEDSSESSDSASARKHGEAKLEAQAVTGRLEDMSPAATAFHSQIFKRKGGATPDNIVKLHSHLKAKLPAGKLEGKGIIPMNRTDLLQILKYMVLHYDANGATKAARPQESANTYTPDETQTSTQPTANLNLPHRTMPAPTKSALKRSGTRRTNNSICFPATEHHQLTCVSQSLIQSFKWDYEFLHYKKPGDYVQCEQCEQTVSAAMGSLHGPVGSRFVKNTFFCIECRPS